MLNLIKVEAKLDEEAGSQIEILSKKLTLAEEERDRLREEFERRVSRKKVIQNKILELKSKFNELRNAKNELNLRISSLKGEVEKLKAEISSKIEEIKVFKGQIFSLKKFTSKPAEDVKKKIESLEWRLQTERYNPIEEKNLISIIKNLEGEAKIHEKIDELRHKISNDKNEINMLKQKLTCLRDEISKLKDLRRRKIEELNMLYDEILKLRVEKEKLVKEIGEVKVKLGDVYNEIGKLKVRLKKLQEELLFKKLEEAVSNMDKITENAEKKLKKGEKLSFEEFKLLVGRGRIRFKGEG